MQKLITVYILLTISTVVAWGAIADIQMLGGGAGDMALGRSYVTMVRDPAIMFNNPAVLADLNGLNLASMYATMVGDYKYYMGAGCIDFGPGVVGLGYVSAMLDEIPSTYYLDDQIYQNGSYSAGDRLLLTSYALGITRLLPLVDRINIGVSGKIYQQWISNTIKTGFGGDVGLTTETDLSDTFIVNRVGFGVGLINLAPPTLTDTTGQSDQVGMHLNLGVRLALLQEKASFAYALIDNTAHAGLEINYIPNLAIRIGNDEGAWTAGLGLSVPDAMGFDYQNMFDCEFNYAFKYINQPGLTSDQSHYFSLHLLGSRKIDMQNLDFVEGEQYVNQKIYTLTGKADEGNQIEIYRNKIFMGESHADSSALWRKNITLENGQNEIYFLQYDPEFSRIKEKSRSMQVILDQNPPVLQASFEQNREDLILIVNADEPLSKVTVRNTDGNYYYCTRVPKTDSWQVAMPLPEEPGKLSFIIEGEDRAGNRAKELKIEHQLSWFGPAQGAVVRGQMVEVSGRVPARVKSIMVNDEQTELGSDRTFAKSVTLPGMGKQSVRISIKTTDGQTGAESHEVIVIPNYLDLPNAQERELVEKIALLGVFENPEGGRFNPRGYVTREQLLKYLIAIEGWELDRSNRISPFKDIGLTNPLLPYIRAGLNNQIIEVPDNQRFEPNNELSRIEALTWLVRDEAAEGDKQKSGNFSDLQTSGDNYDTVLRAIRLGILNESSGQFRPNDKITRIELAGWLSRGSTMRSKLLETGAYSKSDY